jgi:hypothetical protein
MEKDLEILLKPFPNYHAFRLISPSEFESFRYEKDKLGSGIDVVWGIRLSGKTDIHTIRFVAKKWTFADAKKWIKDHDFKPILEEEATGEKSYQLKNKISAIADLKVYEGEGHLFISGYANTKNVADRYGDIPSVFVEKRNYVYDISHFKNNPVMLTKTKLIMWQVVLRKLERTIKVYLFKVNFQNQICQ